MQLLHRYSQVGVWLAGGCLWVYSMVVLGGMTRWGCTR
jgi:hypothetical protein